MSTLVLKPLVLLIVFFYVISGGLHLEFEVMRAGFLPWSPAYSNLALVLIVVIVLAKYEAAHLHEKHANKERLEDGFNSAHYKDGEHQPEFDHEAILGSKDKAEEYEDLPPEEAKKRLRILVTQKGMDEDKDGFVTKQELSNWVDDSLRNLAREDGVERLRQEDKNRDGMVSWQEHLDDNFALEDGKYDPEDAEMIKEDKLLWDAADEDKDGLLNVREFVSFSAPELNEVMHDTVYKMAMEKRDKNKDGFLDFEEFIVEENGLVPDQKSETYISEKVKFETDYDKNKDGKLDKEEIFGWLVPDTWELAVSEAEHLIASSDSDGDGKLSVDEIINNHDVFVGSESTDFGERLHKLHDEL